ncbi:MAG TPA: FAD-dependent oxidoreductase [Burkholderiaceae bacterium]|nr:FAD-dependent oxidoreductase [Burkholderiaceae bacterium]
MNSAAGSPASSAPAASGSAATRTADHRTRFLIVGGGIAAATAADTLRAENPDAAIALISDEPVVPYRRPQLSKALFGAPADRARLLIGDPERYRQRGIDLHLDTRALSLDRHARIVHTDRAGSFRYDALLIATGAAARTLGVAGEALPGICQLRSLADAAELAQHARPRRRALVVGAGFSGLEIAATLRGAGLEVTITDLNDTVYPKLASAELSRFYLDHLRRHGIAFVLGDRITGFAGDRRVREVSLASGRRLKADLVVVAIGVAPNVGFLEGSGLAFGHGRHGGLQADALMRTSDPHVFAAGDVACYADPVLGGYRRVEHWDNAIGQARTAARNMAGARRRYDEVTHFYSDVFEVGFKFLGDPAGCDTRVMRGSLARASAALFYLREGTVRALYSVGRPGDETHAAELLIRYRTPLADPVAQLADESRPLDELMPRQRVLILQGGGALGAFEAGVVRAMEERGHHPDIVAGVSIGAINGAIIASHPRAASAALQSFWRELTVSGMPGVTPSVAQALATWRVAALGLPHFFRPRWLAPSLAPADWPANWTSFYDTGPLRELLLRYVDFPALRTSPVRLLISAVNVETAELEVFDSHVDELRVEHVMASGSLPPGFPWTEIDGRYYWDGGLVSNSPLQQVLDHCGTRGKDVVIVDLFSSHRERPDNLAEVIARRDEITYAERINSDFRARELMQDFRLLVEEITGLVDARTEALIRQRPRYQKLMGDAQPMTITRIVREPEDGERSSRDYDFSAEAIRANDEAGYRLARRMLPDATGETAGKAAAGRSAARKSAVR